MQKHVPTLRFFWSSAALASRSFSWDFLFLANCEYAMRRRWTRSRGGLLQEGFRNEDGILRGSGPVVHESCQNGLVNTRMCTVREENCSSAAFSTGK
jgi:hypothetical protein